MVEFELLVGRKTIVGKLVADVAGKGMDFESLERGTDGGSKLSDVDARFISDDVVAEGVELALDAIEVIEGLAVAFGFVWYR